MENYPQLTMNKAELRQMKKQATKRIYWANHKDTINEKRKETIQCECGMVVNKRHLSQHKENSRHSKNLMQYNVERLEILEDAFDSDIAICVLSFFV